MFVRSLSRRIISVGPNNDSKLATAAMTASLEAPLFGRRKRERAAAEELKRQRQDDARREARQSPDFQSREDDAWAYVWRRFEFLKKPPHLTWVEFHRELTRYNFRWSLKPGGACVFVLSERDEDVVHVNLRSDMSKSNALSCFADQLMLAYQAPNLTYTGIIPFINEGNSRVDLILDIRHGVVEFKYITDVRPKCTCSLPTLTALHLESIVLTLNDKDLDGLPNFMKVEKDHLHHLGLLWDGLRSVAMMKPSPLPLPELLLQENKKKEG
eukprot:PhM_4_TR15463/c0_g1_i1/m.51772